MIAFQFTVTCIINDRMIKVSLLHLILLRNDLEATKESFVLFVVRVETDLHRL